LTQRIICLPWIFRPYPLCQWIIFTKMSNPEEEINIHSCNIKLVFSSNIHSCNIKLVFSSNIHSCNIKLVFSSNAWYTVRVRLRTSPVLTVPISAVEFLTNLSRVLCSNVLSIFASKENQPVDPVVPIMLTETMPSVSANLSSVVLNIMVYSLYISEI